MKVRIEEARLSNAFIYTTGKKYDATSKEKYSAHGIIPKNSPQVAKMKDAIAAAAKEAWPNNWEAKLKAVFAAGRIWCLRDGDRKTDKAGNPQPAYTGNMYVAGKNEIKPSTFGPDTQPIGQDSGKPYSGCYATLMLDVRASDLPQPQIYATLTGVQFVRDGERLTGGGVAAASDFEPIPESAAAQPASQAGGASALF